MGRRSRSSWTGDRDDNTDIYVKAIGGGPPLRLTTDARNDTRPAWSPDGRSIAFMRMFLDQEMFAVFLVPPLGGPERKLGQFYTRFVLGLPLASLAWTTDSKFVLITGGAKTGAQSDILRISVETGEVSIVQQPAAGGNRIPGAGAGSGRSYARGVADGIRPGRGRCC